jgi:long-chain fatty acid transport protein
MSKTNSDSQHRQTQACKSKHVFLLLALSIALAFPTDLRALGFRIPNQDAEATARGNAFVATADNPSALYYNPAGITQLEGLNAQFGAHLISVNSEFHSATTGEESETEFEIQPVPQFYATYTPKNQPFSFGLGIYAPFGLGIEWPENGPLRPFAIEGRLMYTTITPVMAWKIHPTLSVAAGPTFDIATLMLRQGAGIPNGEFHFRGDGFTVGGKVGILWQPHQKWSVGVNYVTPTTIKFSGNSSFKPLTGESDTTMKASFPQFIMAGVSFRPSAHWNLEVGLDWTDWDSLDTVTFNGTPLGNIPFPLNWKSSWLAHSGVSYYFDNRYWIAGGYFFSEDSTTDPDFSALVPDTDLHVVSLGVGRKGEKWSWALSGQLVAGPKRSINNGGGMDGTYQFFNQCVNFSVAYRF